MAGDTRMTDGSYGINTRYAPKVWDVGDNIVITANGYSADCDTLAKRLAQKIEVTSHPSPKPYTLSQHLTISGTITPIIVLFQCLRLQDLLKLFFMGSDSFRIMCIRLLED